MFAEAPPLHDRVRVEPVDAVAAMDTHLSAFSTPRVMNGAPGGDMFGDTFALTAADGVLAIPRGE